MIVSAHFLLVFCTIIVGRANVKVLDLEYPERLGDNIFIQEITEIDSKSKKFSLDKLKVSIYSILDMKDYKKYFLTVVLEGTALLVEFPSIPDFMACKYKKIGKLEKKRCLRTERATAKMMTSITKKLDGKEGTPPPRLTRRVLVVLPQGMIVTDDFKKKEPFIPTVDIPMDYVRREFVDTDTIGSKKTRITQTFNPIYWELRIISAEDNELDHSDDDASSGEDSLVARMSGQATITGDEDGDSTQGDGESMDDADGTGDQS